ncbi:MAG: formaldehyde-activating enzyme [Candidatus Altiarchaeales archaeon WOR_SM1_86-2]|nr:MAG: formaldehyde-activating enzyme [Candidatus Altiarchaeales archaeon WOR_SM1_86-2]
MYKIGEALVGKDNEIAHIDLLIGDKEGYVGQAFAQGLVNLSKGHTPLLGVIRPNLPPKPHTLIIPKVTVEDMGDAGKIFGPAQSGVAKAVADAVEEGIIPEDKIDDWVIIASVFIHPEAKDYRKIYQYNYGATKLALRRAISDYPSLNKINYEKDRATHPIMGFKVPRLPRWNTPYLQIALDVGSSKTAEGIVKKLPPSDKIILEIGTPLIKAEGVKAVSKLREAAPNAFIIADLKTLDVGQVEVDLAFDETADAVVASGLAGTEMLREFIYEAHRLGIYAMVDTMNVPDPVKLLKSISEDSKEKYDASIPKAPKPPQMPDIMLLHRGISGESEKEVGAEWDRINEIKEFAKKKGKDLLVAVAGGIEAQNAREALDKGADIIVVGRYITQSKDVERSVRAFLYEMGAKASDIDLKREHIE